MSIAKTHRAQRPGARGTREGRRTRRFRPQVQALESRELLSVTTLLWSQGVSLPATRGGPAALVSGGSIIVAGGKTSGSATAVNSLAPTAASWATLRNLSSGRVGPGFVAMPSGL